MKTVTLGVSPKLIADLLTSIVAFALAYFAVDLDPTVAALLAKAIGAVAAYLAPAGEVLQVTDAPPVDVVNVR